MRPDRRLNGDPCDDSLEQYRDDRDGSTARHHRRVVAGMMGRAPLTVLSVQTVPSVRRRRDPQAEPTRQRGSIGLAALLR
jgi:hypothetical protein